LESLRIGTANGRARMRSGSSQQADGEIGSIASHIQRI
jgi:hypothetical protein